jgi:NitT/TauT family transport system permease protein
LWQFIALQVGFHAIFPPLTVLMKQVFHLFVSEHFFLTVFHTIYRGIIGFTIAFLLALLSGSIAFFSPFWKNFIHPIIVVTRSIPVISLVLLAILWFSPTQLPVFIALLTMFPILYSNILTGLEQTDIRFVEMAQVFGISSYKRFTEIYLQSAKPLIFSGISTAMGFGWRAVYWRGFGATHSWYWQQYETSSGIHQCFGINCLDNSSITYQLFIRVFNKSIESYSA